MKILVTGANGYLGQGIVKELLNCGYEVIATSKHVENIGTRAHIEDLDNRKTLEQESERKRTFAQFHLFE